jgi:hypothetical protein
VRTVRLRGGRLTFVLSEPATVRVTIMRGSSAVRRLTVTAEAGANALAIKLRRGRYRVVLSASDAAGNAARPASARVKA